jgi:hypothetical protein
MTVHKADEKLVHSYLYIRNLDPVKENFLYVFADTAADDPVVMKIGGGEFAFVPVQEDQLFKAYGTKAEQLIEYGVFGLDNASNFLA